MSDAVETHDVWTFGRDAQEQRSELEARRHRRGLSRDAPGGDRRARDAAERMWWPGRAPRSPSGQPPARKPVPATPIAPVVTTPAIAVGIAGTAAKTGVVAGPPLYSLPISEAQAARALATFRNFLRGAPAPGRPHRA